MEDVILNEVISRAVPVIHLFGVYVVVHGHLSPGGGFAGGSVMGIALVLFALVFGLKATLRIVPEGLLTVLTTLGPLWYAGTGIIGMLLGHEFLANAQAGVPLGRAGSVLSSGLVPVITVGVGISVALTVVVLFVALVEED